MKVLLINEVFGTTSTGKICAQIAEQLEAEGCDVKVAYGRWKKVPDKYQRFAHYIGSAYEVKLHVLQTRLFDLHGFGSVRVTKKFLKWAESFQPDLIWLHNLHGYYINIELLFAWIKMHPEMQVRWTLHDCWAFTGHCAYFSAVNCEQWKTGCKNCPQLRKYPACYGLGAVEQNYARKKKAFSGVCNMVLITPSKWLANLVKQSFLKDYPVEVHYNRINRDDFKPTSSDFRKRHNLENKIVVLGVASIWDERKGIGDFYQLANMLTDQYAIVLVGLTEKQIRKLPQNIIGIERTSSPKELAAIYTAADVFVNPTHEDNYPTVNLEAQACGAKLITYNTGGSVETLEDGIHRVVDCGDVFGLKREIEAIVRKANKD